MKKVVLIAAMIGLAPIAAQAESTEGKLYSGIQASQFHVLQGSLSSSNTDVALSAIARENGNEIYGSVSFGSARSTLDFGYLFGVTHDEQFFVGAGAGIWLDSYAGSTATFYDKAGLSGIVGASYNLTQKTLVNLDLVYRLSGAVADQEYSLNFGVAHAF